MMDFGRLELLKNKGFNPKKSLDIGANLGRFIKPFSLIWPECKNTLIEPNPFCYPFLSNLGHRYIVAALSNKEEVRDFYISKLDIVTSGASFYKENNPTTNHFDDENIIIEKIKTIRLDSLLPNEIFDFIKIDVQGSEYEIIDGGKNIISNAKYILVECGLADYNPGSPDIEQIIRLLQSYGFTLYDALEFHRSTDLYNNCIFQIDFLFKNSIID